MPIFGGAKRPKLDGLTRDEEKRRDALNPEVLRRAGEKGVAGQAPAAASLLREKMNAEPRDPLWPLLLGHQMMSMRRYALAIEAFEDEEVRLSVRRRPDAVAGRDVEMEAARMADTLVEVGEGGEDFRDRIADQIVITDKLVPGHLGIR